MTDDVEVKTRAISLEVMGLSEASKAGWRFGYANKICAALRAYGNQREREALERAAEMVSIDKIEETDGYSIGYNVACRTLNRAILALIPKGPAND